MFFQSHQFKDQLKSSQKNKFLESTPNWLLSWGHVTLHTFVFNWGGIKPRQTTDKEVWPNPISVSMGV